MTEKKKRKKKSKKRPKSISKQKETSFPRFPVKKALRIPRAILDQNAGNACSRFEAASFCDCKVTGSFGMEIAAANKYGFLSTENKNVQPTELAKQILRPKQPSDEVDGLRKAILNAPGISAVYSHYRGENLPEDQFLKNTAVDKYCIPETKFLEFKEVLLESLTDAKLIEKFGAGRRLRDISDKTSEAAVDEKTIKKQSKAAGIISGDTCFVVQPFAMPFGNYYTKIYKPAIEKAGLTPVRADADIFATGKIIDQVWRGIKAAKVLVAELTTRNPNVFYELGLAHALRKPVVLVSSNEEDVPFDLKHIRVIYYDMTDPFWGQKLIDKVAENIVSAIERPEEAVFEATTSDQ